MADVSNQAKETIRSTSASNASLTYFNIFAFTNRHHLLALLPGLLFSAASGLLQPALAVVFGRFFSLFTDYAAGKIISTILEDKCLACIYNLVGIAAATLITKGLLFGLWLVFGELQAKTVRDRFFRLLLEKDTSGFEAQEGGLRTFTASLQIQIREFQIGSSLPLGLTILYLVQTLVSIGLALYYDWRLTLVVFSSLPVVVIVLGVLLRKVEIHNQLEGKALQSIIAISSIALSHLSVIKCLNCEQYEQAKYTKAVRHGFTHFTTNVRLNGAQAGFLRFVTTAMFVQGFWYGGSRVHAGLTTAGSVVTAFWCCLIAVKALEDLQSHIFALGKTASAVRLLQDVLDRISQAATVAGTGHTAPAFCDGDIEFRHVSFAYDTKHKQQILTNLDLFFPAAETTFLIGKSGSGKSTVASLLFNFNIPNTGQIFMDGLDISQVSTLWLRNNVAIVSQNSVVFNESLFKNVAFGRHAWKHVKREEVLDCLSFAALRHFSVSTPLESILGVGGHTLSGGQAQRLSIARARLRNAPVLILDEATSALDPKTKTVIVGTLRQWRQGKTTIIITHDLDQIQNDDFVYCLENGSVVGEGFRRDLSHLFTDQRLPVSDGIKEDENALSFPSQGQQTICRRGAQLYSTPVTREDCQSASNTARSLALAQAHGVEQPPVLVDVYKDQLRRHINKYPLTNTLAVSQDITSQHAMQKFAFSNGGAHSLQRKVSKMYRPMSIHQAVMMKSIYLDNTPQDNAKLGMEQQSETGADQELAGPEDTAFQTQEREVSIAKVLRSLWLDLNHCGRCKFVVGIFATTLHACAPPAFSYTIVQLFGTFYMSDGYYHRSLSLSFVILGIATLDGFATFIMISFLGSVGQNWVNSLRVKAFRQILRQPISWCHQANNGPEVLVSTLDQDSKTVEGLISQFFAFSLVAVVTLSASLVWSLTLCWKITIVALSTSPILYFLTKAFEAGSTRRENSIASSNDSIGMVFTEAFADIRTVRSLTLEEYFHRKYTKISNRSVLRGIWHAVLCGALFGISDSAIVFLTALIFWYGSHLTATGVYSVQSVLTVFALLLFGMANVNAVLANIPQTSAGRRAASQLINLANLAAVHHEEKNLSIQCGEQLLPNIGPVVRFANFSFAYPSKPADPILQNLSLTIWPGTCTAIVGSSGCGKSTLASILMGLYHPGHLYGQGSISIFGHDIRSFTPSHLRSLVSIVPQTPVIFPTTIRNNIAYGLISPPEESSTITQSRIETAARSAEIHEFISTLPQGYDTVVTSASSLSGGQAQRITLARAFFRSPRILILDEATSALDQVNADAIRCNISRLIKSSEEINGQNLTVIVVTHSISMMKFADRVVVLDQGRVVEDGGFDHLMRQRGYLWDLVGK